MNEKRLKISFNASINEHDIKNELIVVKKILTPVKTMESPVFAIYQQRWNLPETILCLEEAIPEAQRLSHK